MSDSTGSGDKSTGKSSKSETKDSGSSKTPDSAGAATTEAGKSAKESIGGASEVHYGFFSSVRTPEYRSGWDDIWGGKDQAKAGRKSKPGSRSGSKSGTGPKPVTVGLEIADLPDDVRDGLVEAARKKMRKSRANYEKLESSGRIDWTISVTANSGRE